MSGCRLSTGRLSIQLCGLPASTIPAITQLHSCIITCMKTSCDIDPSRQRALARLRRADAPTEHDACRVPVELPDGQIRLDPWWGSIQPHKLHPDVETVGELELIEHITAGGKVIDTRRREYVERTGVIPTAEHVEWESINDHPEAFDDNGPTVLYCNGPQCGATPNAVRLLLEAGRDPKSILYYRGGMQDWMGLGLPVEPLD